MRINQLLFALTFLPFLALSQVGIGTSNPQSTLHVEGTLRVTSTHNTTTSNAITGINTASGEITEVTIGNNLTLNNNTLSAKVDNSFYKIANRAIITPISNTQFNNFNLDVSGANSDVIIFRITGATKSFDITGISGGVDGRHIFIYNVNAVNMSFVHLNGASLPQNRINDLGTGTSTNGQGVVELVYDGVLKKWLIIDERK